MNILVIGGTRLLGKKIVNILTHDHKVTILSRKEPWESPGVDAVIAERKDGLREFSGKTFDLVIDTIAYSGTDVEQFAASKIKTRLYCFISSTWICKLCPELSADQPLDPKNAVRPDNMLDVTWNYLLSKVSGEARVLRRIKGADKTLVVRLPIFWDENEHTKRLQFYRARVFDGKPVILVNGGTNMVQIAWATDVADALCLLLQSTPRPDGIIEALPHDMAPVHDVVDLIGADQNFSTVKFKESDLSLLLPEYLQEEPLWRENPVSPSRTNLFSLSGRPSTLLREWLPMVAQRTSPGPETELRRKEIEFLRAHLK